MEFCEDVLWVFWGGFGSVKNAALAGSFWSRWATGTKKEKQKRPHHGPTLPVWLKEKAQALNPIRESSVYGHVHTKAAKKKLSKLHSGVVYWSFQFQGVPHKNLHQHRFKTTRTQSHVPKDPTPLSP